MIVPRERGDALCWPPTFLQEQGYIEELRWIGSKICTHWCRGANDCADVPGTECLRITRRGDGVCLPPEGQEPGMEPEPQPDPGGEPNDPDEGGNEP